MLSRPAACQWQRDGLLPAANAGLRTFTSALCPDRWLKRPTLLSETTCAGARATLRHPRIPRGAALRQWAYWLGGPCSRPWQRCCRSTSVGSTLLDAAESAPLARGSPCGGNFACGVAHTKLLPTSLSPSPQPGCSGFPWSPPLRGLLEFEIPDYFVWAAGLDPIGAATFVKFAARGDQGSRSL